MTSPVLGRGFEPPTLALDEAAFLGWSQSYLANNLNTFNLLIVQRFRWGDFNGQKCHRINKLINVIRT